MRQIRRLPLAVRFMVGHGLLGFMIATLFVGGLLWLGREGFGALVWNVGGWQAVALLWFFTGLTFGSAMIGGAVMLIGPEERGPRGGRLVPVRVPARASRRA